MRLYFKYAAMHLKSIAEYRASFLMLALGQILVPFGVFAGMLFLFERFGQLKGWTLAEVALLYGVIHLAFAISECFARGFDTFSSLVVSGQFDRLLVRPRGTVVQVLGTKMEFSRVGRMLQGMVILGWALSRLETVWTPVKAATVLFMVAGAVCIFFGIYLLTAALCFWTIQGLEVGNVFKDGGREMAQYPLNIYEHWVVKFFTFVIPFGAVSYLPLLSILGRAEGPDWLYMLMPLAGALFVLPCLLVWRLGVRHYRSAGS